MCINRIYTAECRNDGFTATCSQGEKCGSEFSPPEKVEVC